MSLAQSGDVVFSHKKSGLYPWLVHYYTGGPSHCFFLAGDFMDHLSAFESDLKCQLVPWLREYGEKQVDNYEAYRPILASPDMVRYAAKSCFYLYSGEVYGFAQLLYWPWKAIRSFFGFKKVIKNNLATGLICSELLLHFIFQLGGPYQDLVRHLDPDEVSPADLLNLVRARPDLFSFVEARDLGKGAWRPLPR